MLPAFDTFHIGYVRDEVTLLPSLYLNKLPEKFASGARILVSDPMLATGGTMVACVTELLSRGAQVAPLSHPTRPSSPLSHLFHAEPHCFF